MNKVDQIKALEQWDIWWDQILFWRSHLDIAIEEMFGVKLKDTQKVVARAIGNGTDIKVVKSRGYGKTWQIAWCACALCVLYPYNKVAVVSATAAQATLVIRKIRDFSNQYPDLRRELQQVGKDLIPISAEKGVVTFKNGSTIESFTLTRVVGERAKVLILDEGPRADENMVKKNASPILNYTRDVCLQKGYEDFESKFICITSACLKSNWFYRDFMDTYNAMLRGSKKHYAFALDWTSAVRIGITSKEYFTEKMRELPESVFATEYGSIFLGEESGSIFPFALTEKVRTMKHVEYSMPKNCTSYYVMAVDLASSASSSADNSVICVLKCNDREDGSIMKRLVYLRSYHGMLLDDMAEEVRKTYVRFPKVTKIVFDQRGLGFGFDRFFADPWVDPLTSKEYSAWIVDNGKKGGNPAAILRPFVGDVQSNQQLATGLRVALEQKTLLIPCPSNEMREQEFAEGGDTLSMEERAIYLEADALQVEMGNIVMRRSANGSATYDCAKTTQHKDRYSALAMAVWYVGLLEDENKQRVKRLSSASIGVISYF